MFGHSSGDWSPGSDFEDVEVLWPESNRYRQFAKFGNLVIAQSFSLFFANMVLESHLNELLSGGIKSLIKTSL